MRTMYLAFLVTALVTAVAYVGLQQAGFSSAERTAGPAVRLQ